MKKTIIVALASASAFIAMPAAAQVTGTVNITGNVTGRCSVVQPGAGAGAGTFSGTIALSTLDDADGTLKDSLQGTTAGAAAGTPVATRVVCTTAAPTVSIAATSLVTGSGNNGGNGYSDNIDYTARVDVNTASGGIQSRAINTVNGQAPSGLASSGALTDRIAAGAANNVSVSIYGLAAENGATSLLNAGDYTATVTVSIQPGV